LIRKANKEDFQKIFSLAEKFDLDSVDMDTDNFIVAEENGEIVGIGQLKKFGNDFELCCLGVEANSQKKGIGKELVKALVSISKEAGNGNVYLATIIPSYFEKLGFQVVKVFPEFMRKKEEWCGFCKDRKNCTVMQYKT